MPVNKAGINLPEYIEGYGIVKPYQGAFSPVSVEWKKPIKGAVSFSREDKIVDSLEEAIKKSGLKSGMTISFHHHLRDGDGVMIRVVAQIAEMGIRDIHINSSSFTNAHEGILEYIKQGVITKISTSGLRGKMAEEISKTGILPNPIVFRTHGGRVRAIESGDIHINVAFIGAPACDKLGNMNGHEGACAFGAMGYPMVDAQYADVVIALTDNLKPYPLSDISIDQTYVDYVVLVDTLGDPTKIASGATRITSNPSELFLAKKAADVLIASGLIRTGFSFQAGAGGAALAVCRYLREYMEIYGIKGSFASGGINAYLVELLDAGLFETLVDVQTFDGTIADSIKKRPNHIEMSASMYANLYNKSCVAHQLDIMILSATEIDLDFNVNSLTGSHGMIMGAVGGAPDTAAGAKWTVMVVPAMRKRLPIVVDKVTHIVTPNETVDVLVTDMGICVNPKRPDILETLTKHRIPICDIKGLYHNVQKLTGTPKKIEYTDKIVGIIEYRDGTVLDVIKQIK
ncbi:MAG: citrate lyase subunit alpha [Brevinema sp.]